METDFRDPTDESRAINIYNEAIPIYHIKNTQLRAFKKIKGKLKDPDRSSEYSEAHRSIQLRLYPNTQSHSIDDLIPQEDTYSPEDVQYIAHLLARPGSSSHTSESSLSRDS